MASKSSLPQKNQPSKPSRRGAPWPLYAAVAALLLVIAGVIVWQTGQRGQTASPTQVSGQPRLTVDRESVDFGKVPMNELVKATFVLSNAGDQALQILGEPVVEVREGC